ncbi:hypothetical protein [Pengzhenrongella sicca]|uniref:Uncharacterized protein n=1 Tax=Pengzhenrongella sicca TaxID=2819238 RepID=A0A8A4Z9Q1_9MICO|nr:hypothetical protein [Pengzhenrongella sicca]QTE28151.1 hypothetical protein J4E96_12205 [Pengzhenrongella sicca]
MNGIRHAVLTCKCGSSTHAGHQAYVDGGFEPHTYAGGSDPDAARS